MYAADGLLIQVLVHNMSLFLSSYIRNLFFYHQFEPGVISYQLIRIFQTCMFLYVSNIF